MKRSLAEYVADWNSHERRHRIIFAVNEPPGTGRPTSIEIRYSAVRYQRYLSIEQWDRLVAVVEGKSHGTMYVASSEKLFRRGIVDVKIASCNHNYQEYHVIGVLRWIAEEFFSVK